MVKDIGPPGVFTVERPTMSGEAPPAWEEQAAAEAFYAGPWVAGIRARYGCEPRISSYGMVASADRASGRAGALEWVFIGTIAPPRATRTAPGMSKSAL